MRPLARQLTGRIREWLRVFECQLLTMGVAAMRYQIQTGRNPFARETVRKRKHEYKRTCDFCGSTNRRGFVWQYLVDCDSRAGVVEIPGGYCSIGCVNAYHN